MRRLLLILTGVICSFGAMAQLTAPDTALYPIDSATNIPVNVRLLWKPSLGGPVANYEAQISLDSLFTTPIPVTCHGTSAKLSELKFGQTYYWRARAKGVNGSFSPYSKPRSFTTFNDQFYLYEADSGITVAGQPKRPEIRFSWDSVSGVSNYEFQLDEDTLFGSPQIINISRNINGNPVSQHFDSTNVNNLAFGQKYHWRIRASHSQDVSGWSTVRTFTTISTLTLNTPAPSATNVPPTVNLGCFNTPGVLEYRFVLDTSTTFDPNSTQFQSGNIFDNTVSDANNILFEVKRLAFGQQYYFSVQGVNNSGLSSWSAPRAFTTVSQVSLIAPDSGDGKVPSEFEMTWKKIPGVDSYQMQIDTDPTFNNPLKRTVFEDTARKDTVGRVEVFLDWSKMFYWRVRAIHSKDTSDWSQVRTFNVRPLGISENVRKPSFDMHPNPANDAVVVSLSGVNAVNVTLDMFDVLGNKIDHVNGISWDVTGSTIIDLSGFQPGLYFVVVGAENSRLTKKLIVR